MDTKDIAVYAAIVSTYGAILATVIAWRQWKRRIKVTVVTAIMGTSAEPTSAFIVTAANPGPRPISIHGAALQLANGKQLVMPEALYAIPLPHHLDEGQNCSFYFPLTFVSESLIKEGFSGKVTLHAVIRDAFGKTYKSKRFTGTVEDWAQG